MGLQTELETRQIEQLIQAIDELRRRVAALEERLPVPAGSAPLLAAPEAVNGGPAVHELSSGLLPALGRLLLGMAGAYFLRAITEAQMLPHLAGTIAGMLYAAAWLIVFLRFASSDQLIVALQGVTASIIAGPLVWEATVRFHSFTPASAAVALAAFMLLGQVIAWRPKLSLIAGITALAGSATAVALIVATLNPIPFAIGLAAVAAVVEFGACRDRVLSTRWVIATAADFCAFLLIYLRTRPQGLPEGYAPISIPVVITLLISVITVYIGSIVTRTLIRRLPIGWFEIAQVVSSVTLCIAGARLLTGESISGIVIGITCVIAGMFCYLVSFTDVRLRPVIGRNFHAYATFGFLLTLTGSLLLFPAPVLSFIWPLLGILAIWLGEQRSGNSLRLHGTVYFAAGAVISGLLTYAAQTMLGTPSHKLTAWAVFCAFTLAAGYGMTLARHATRVWMERIAPSILAALLCWSVAGICAGVFLTDSFDRGLASTLRTMLVCGIGVALTWFGRRRSIAELIWLLYPWMVFGAIKLFAEDFQQGRPATLFVSLLVYGGTLIALPRLWRRAKLS